MKHLTTDELVDRLYGIAEAGHLENCAECAQRFDQLRERRAMVTEPGPEPVELLAAQRRSIHARMEERPRAGMKWVPALAAGLCLVAVGVATYHPKQNVPSQAAKAEIDDTQLFSDVYSMEQSMEPIAAKPIHALFEQDE
jgi:predicted anti-sigma-YlaC factor YlaD